MSRRHAIRTFFAAAVAVAWLALAVADAATLDARLSSDNVASGQAVTLTLGSVEPLPAEVDLSPLAQDFRILEQRRAESVSTLNGRRNVRHELMLTLLPRRTGALRVPSLAIGDTASPALALSVAATTNPNARLLAAPAQAEPRPASTAPQAIAATADISPQRGVVGQEFVLTVRASSTDGPPVGRLLMPRAADARMLPLGTRRDQDARGQQIFEQRFSLFPQRTGRLRITDLGFEAWQPAGGKPVSHSVAPLAVAVTGQPPGTDAKTWLPARSLTLTEAGPAEVRIAPGQGIERMLTLRAEGLMAEDLPPIPLDVPVQLRARNDPPRLWNERTPDGVVGYRAERILISAPDPGKYVLPGPSIAWWDTNAATMRTATLPDWTLTVAPFASEDRRPAARWEQDQVTAADAGEAAGARTGTGQAADNRSNPESADSGAGSGAKGGIGWPIVLAAVGIPILAVLAWLGLRGGSRGRPRPPEPVAPAPAPEQEAATGEALEALIATVRDAYAAVDAPAARAALLSWAAQSWPGATPRNLSQLVLRVEEPPLRDDLKLLDAAFYGPGDNGWAQRPVAERLAALAAGGAAKTTTP
jgi:hypothetical protein